MIWDIPEPPRGPPFREDPHGIVQLVKGFPLLKESVVSSVLPAKMNELTHQNCDLSPKNVNLTCINDDSASEHADFTHKKCDLTRNNWGYLLGVRLETPRV